MLEILHNQEAERQVSKEQALVLPLGEVGIADIPLVGAKTLL